MKHQWLAEISKQLIPASEVPPKGYISAAQAGKELGVGYSTARRKLNEAFKLGKVDRVTVRIHNGKQGQGGTFSRVWYYGEK